jgi:hypothetical protein
MSDEPIITYEEFVALLEQNKGDAKSWKEIDFNMWAVEAIVSTISKAIVAAIKTKTVIYRSTFHVGNYFAHPHFAKYKMFSDHVFERFPFMKFDFATSYDDRDCIKVNLRCFTVSLPSNLIEKAKFY